MQCVHKKHQYTTADAACFQSVPKTPAPACLETQPVAPRRVKRRSIDAVALRDLRPRTPPPSEPKIPVNSAFVTDVRGPRRDMHIANAAPEMRHIVVHDKPVGEGGQSVIYAAANPATGAGLVYKQLRTKNMQAALAEAIQEANIARELDSPLTPMVVKQDNSVALLAHAMPTNLSQSIRGIDASSPARLRLLALSVVMDLAKNLAELHEKGYVHCDVKSDNVLAGTDGRWLLADFGHAADRNDADELLRMRGTTAFWPPEVFTGEPFSPKADVYALGLLYLTVLNRGTPPMFTASLADFYADADDWETFVSGGFAEPKTSAWMQDHPAFATIYNGLAESERRLIRCMLHPDPKERPDAKRLLGWLETTPTLKNTDDRRRAEDKLLRRDSFRRKHHERMCEVLAPQELKRCSSLSSYGSSSSEPLTPRTPKRVDRTPRYPYPRG